LREKDIAVFTEDFLRKMGLSLLRFLQNKIIIHGVK